MVSINTSLSASTVRGVYELQASTRLMEDSLQRIRTGYRITSAKDDPAGLVDGLDLSRRISSFDAAIRNNQSSYYELSRMDDAQRSMLTMLQDMRSKLVQVRDETDSNILDAALASVAELVDAYTGFAQTSLRNGQKLMTGSGKIDLALDSANTLLDINATHTRTARDTSSLLVNFDNTNVASRAIVRGTFQAPAGTDSVYTFTSDQGNRTLTFAVGATIDDVISQINTELDDIGVYAAKDEAGGTGVLAIATSEFGAARSLSLNLDSGNSIFTAAPTSVAGSDGSINIGGRTFALTDDLRIDYADGLISTSLVFDDERVSNNIFGTNPGATVGAEWSNPASTSEQLKPTGGLYLHTGINTGTYDSERIGFRDLTAATLGLEDIVTSGTSNYMLTNIDEAIETVDAAFEQVTQGNAELGSVLGYTLESQNTHLKNMLDDLYDQRSMIMDTDEALETARIVKMQLLQQAGISTLSAENTSRQNMMSLFDAIG